MSVMAKEKKTYPSRQKTKYVGIPRKMFDLLEEVGKADERSVAYLARKAIEKWLREDKGIKYDPRDNGQPPPKR